MVCISIQAITLGNYTIHLKWQQSISKTSNTPKSLSATINVLQIIESILIDGQKVINIDHVDTLTCQTSIDIMFITKFTHVKETEVSRVIDHGTYYDHIHIRTSKFEILKSKCLKLNWFPKKKVKKGLVRL